MFYAVSAINDVMKQTSTGLWMCKFISDNGQFFRKKKSDLTATMKSEYLFTSFIIEYNIPGIADHA